ncbi:MAG TPA: metal-dependent transcriptional regulator [Candidatus Hydrogenedentes bacterium]|nr:metal-dependent transcriptional regulator [Candidatus Hydrogenedentota bacterium]
MSRTLTHTGVSPHQEDYLEAIFWLTQEDRVARSRDITRRMGVTKSTVTGALRQLRADGLVNYAPYSYVTLTREGLAIARNVARRHAVLREFLCRILGMDYDAADALACAFEHSIDAAALDRFEAFLEFAASDAPDLRQWIERQQARRKEEN